MNPPPSRVDIPPQPTEPSVHHEDRRCDSLERLDGYDRDLLRVRVELGPPMADPRPTTSCLDSAFPVASCDPESATSPMAPSLVDSNPTTMRSSVKR